ncbi:MAG: HemK2/MTQ2 family protein methyltransferase [Nanoarchaeota archaeon]
MTHCKSVYQPQEDSTLLEKYVRQYSKGKVLDIGTGSGIQAIAAAQSKKVSSVLATDVQKGVVGYCRKNIKNKKIKFLRSDLFKNIKGKFDTIIFNPPYLPQELKLKDLTIEGGKKGYEVIESFLDEVKHFLDTDGIVLMVFSSLTKKVKVDEFIKNNLLDFEELYRQHIFFEDIYMYLLRKNGFLKKLESNEIKKVKYFAKGHRGLLFTGIYKNKKVIIKTKNPESMAIGRILNEAKWLKRLNKLAIGPKILISSSDYIIYRYIEGKFMLDYLCNSNNNKIKKVIKKIFAQMFVLDKLRIDKEEMHHPVKHVIVSKGKPVLLDFERVHNSDNPKNVTQFCQFITSGHVNHLLKNKKIGIDKHRVIELARIYKGRKDTKNFKKIIEEICK